jgi:HlyD family secretion protein
LKKLLLLLPLLAAAAIVWGIVRKSEPPKVNIAHVRRQTLVSTLPTNGKVEPYEWRAVRAETAGIISRLAVHDGDTVARNAELAVIADPSLQADMQSAEARVDEAKANLAALQAGGRPAELAEIDSSLARTRAELAQQVRDAEALERLAAKQAATPAEVQAAQEKIRQSRLAIEGLQKRRASQIAPPEVAAAQARLQEAEVAVERARSRAALTVVRSPIGGVVYELAVHPGGYLNVGDVVTHVGQLDRVHVRVYVDEPELGRVSVGQPVAITWQALPGRKWQGAVERMPTSIQALGSRQVGEVVCTIENPGHELIPGTNVDAEIRTAVVNNALVIPREALRHDDAGNYVLALKSDTLERRSVKTGTSSVTQVQILEGLAEGDSVAMPSDVPVKPGDRVQPSAATT